MGADGRRVLIADGDRSLRQQLYSALLETDIFSDCVSTIDDALEKLGSDRYGLVVFDVGLPDGDAERVVARIRELPLQSRPVVIALAAKPATARGLDVDIVQIVLRRPVIFSHLVELIRNCIRTAANRNAVPGPEKENGNGNHMAE
ncbi:MAG: response regulator [Acidobacteriota bacterium]|nr:response regulator [Acidobacteriota bacterium]